MSRRWSKMDRGRVEQADPGSLPRTFVLLAALVGLATSSLLLFRAATGESACGLNGSCQVVQSSSWATVLGLPLPAWGLAYFGVVAWIVARREGTWPPALRAVVVAGGFGGASLIVVQLVVLDAICPWCMCVDLAAIGLAAAAVWGAPLVRPPRHRAMASVLVVAASVTPVVVLELALSAPATEPELPTADLAALTETEIGVAKIIEFVDIECPFCREQHARLDALIGEVGAQRVQVQVHHLPIARHKHAAAAAAIACCSEAQGHGRSVLGALMASDDLSAAQCRATAVANGVDPDLLDACLESDVPAQRLASDRQQAVAVGVRSLPTCVIGGQRFEGAQSTETLRRALLDALDHDEDAESGGGCST